MQKQITVKEFGNTIKSVDNIEKSTIVKRENKKEYQKEKVHSARTVFKELREKYGY